jgi:hypothetical protein
MSRAEWRRMQEDLERTPITAEELKTEILHMLAKKFAHRPLDMQTAQSKHRQSARGDQGVHRAPVQGMTVPPLLTI